jgi:fatty-acyl-CoA synthase
MGTGSATRPAELAKLLRAPDPIGTESSVLDLRIVDDAMNDVEQRQLGEIVVRGPAITPGYFEDEDANRALFQGGWHHTGDIAYRDPSGCIYFVDRKKDMIKTGGENVASLEVEEALAMHPAVGEVAVFGVSDPYWIEKVVAAVILVSEATPQELEQFARTKIAGFKVPKEIHIVNELPKNPTGKVLKRELRKRFETATGAAG